MTPRSELESQLAQVVQQLPELELQMVTEHATRILTGARRYGPFKPKDKRNMAQESAEEVHDALVYVLRLLFQLRGK